MQAFASVLVTLLALQPAHPEARYPEQERELKYYYCFAPIESQLTILRGPIENVGPREERAGYPRRFAKKLVAAGLLRSENEPVYCTMRGTQAEIDRGRRDLVEYCPFSDDGTLSPLCGKKWTVKDVFPSS